MNDTPTGTVDDVIAEARADELHAARMAEARELLQALPGYQRDIVRVIAQVATHLDGDDVIELLDHIGAVDEPPRAPTCSCRPPSTHTRMADRAVRGDRRWSCEHDVEWRLAGVGPFEWHRA